ncbi:lipoprotein; DLP12 prophage [Psychromonas sp. CNPT3]|uniref:Bor family protein n=1 Tax=Psychromonas sp. CNPT3 TaxID=314282 RepID=UPI00006E9CF3|nr:Bor family protein [Psychromonas sp. CNPT3]AGH81195.1 lipoprotein; DLP12 prophage [Psychromonas sp. CNPT3]
MKFKLLSLALCIGLLGGCAAQTFTINGENGENGETPTTQQSQNFFISGLGQEKVIDAAAVCGGAENVIKVEAQHTLINGLLGFVTFGIYTPRDAKVYCK